MRVIVRVKKSLIDFGFRLPSAYDNRPLKFEEIERYFKDAIFVSATPGDYELATIGYALLNKLFVQQDWLIL